MIGMEELKENIEPKADEVECPVRGCRTKVRKMKIGDPKSLDSYLERRKTSEATQKFGDFFCREHRIYITPSTFIYEDFKDNLLWYEKKDREVLDKIMEVKRVKAQLHHDNSEDAVSWNVFRFLERNNLIEEFLSSITRSPIKSSEVIYWSYSQKEGKNWSELNEAREQFGEEKGRGSEPDIIVKTDKALFFIEAKLTAGNETEPSDKSSSKRYETGGDNWFSKVFKSDYKKIAIKEKKYELLRFWLLGTWMAEQQDLDFYLVNLVRAEKELDIETIFKRHINESQRRKFLRVTWERIYQYISNSSLTIEKDIMVRFFRNKTVGYDGKGKLQRAFLN